MNIKEIVYQFFTIKGPSGRRYLNSIEIAIGAESINGWIKRIGERSSKGVTERQKDKER